MQFPSVSNPFDNPLSVQEMERVIASDIHPFAAFIWVNWLTQARGIAFELCHLNLFTIINIYKYNISWHFISIVQFVIMPIHYLCAFVLCGQNKQKICFYSP